MAEVTLHFHGVFSSFVEGAITVVSNTAAEAIDVVTRQVKGFKPTPYRGKYTIRVKGFEKVEALFTPLEDKVTLHIWPAIQGGGGKGGFIKVVLGVVLIAAAVMMPASIGSLTLYGTTTVASALMNFGISMLIGGLLEMLSPAPKIDMSPVAQDPEASKYLGSGQNTVKIGTRIPLLYGTYKVPGHYISFNIDAKDVNSNTDTPSPETTTPTATSPTSGSYVVGNINPTPLVISLPEGLSEATHIKVNSYSGCLIYKDAEGQFQLGLSTYLTVSEASAGIYISPTSDSFYVRTIAVKMTDESNVTELGNQFSYDVSLT